MQYNLQGELTLMDNLDIKPNYAALGRKYGMDWRTVKKYHEGYKGKPNNREKRACQLKCVSFLFPLVFKGCSVDGADRYSGHF